MSNLKDRLKAGITVSKATHEENVRVEWLNKSGIYNAKIISVIERESESGAVKATITFEDIDSGKHGSVSMWVVNKDGDEIQMGKSLMESLIVCSGLKAAKGKIVKIDGYVDNKKAKVEAIEYSVFKDKVVYISLRRVYSIYNDALSVSNDASRFFNKDKLTSTNIMNKVVDTKAFATEEKLIRTKYSDGLDEDIIEAYYNARAKDKNVKISTFLDGDYTVVGSTDSADEDDGWGEESSSKVAEDIGEEYIDEDTNTTEKKESSEVKTEDDAATKKEKSKEVAKKEASVADEDEDDDW